MKTTIISVSFSLVILFGFPIYVEAQTENLLSEASRELITKIEHENFTLLLERFENDGVLNLSMSKGFEFIRIGSDLETILNTLWPKRNFDISPEIQNQNYHLMLQHLDQKRTEEFLEIVLMEFLTDSGFDVHQKKVIQFQHCVVVESEETLSSHLFVPDHGIIRSTTYSREELTLSGFTLEDIIAEISNKSGSMFSINNYGLPDQTFELSFNVKNLNTIKESLKRYGLSSSECEREVEVIYVE